MLLLLFCTTAVDGGEGAAAVCVGVGGGGGGGEGGEGNSGGAEGEGGGGSRQKGRVASRFFTAAAAGELDVICQLIGSALAFSTGDETFISVASRGSVARVWRRSCETDALSVRCQITKGAEDSELVLGVLRPVTD